MIKNLASRLNPVRFFKKNTDGESQPLLQPSPPAGTLPHAPLAGTLPPAPPAGTGAGAGAGAGVPQPPAQDAGSSNADANTATKKDFAVGGDFVITMVALIIGVGVSVMLIPCMVLGIMDIYKLSNFLKKEARRIENGEKVLIYDSTIYKILKYAENDNNNRQEFFNVYMYLSFAKYIFSLANLAIFLLFVNFAIKIALAIEGNSIGSAVDDVKFLKGFALSMYTAIVFVIYVKYIYKRVFEDGIYPEIRKRYDALVDLDNTMYNAMISHPSSTATTGDTATDFYTKLQLDDIQGIIDNLSRLTREDDITKQIVTLNIYEYYKKNVPNFNSSEIKTRLFTNDGIRAKNIRPSLFLRIDCTNPIINIYHSLGLEDKIDENLREGVETTLSQTMNTLNQKISKVKLEAQPVVSLFRNYLKTSGTFFLIVTFLYILFVMKMFDIRYEGSGIQAVVLKIKSWFVSRFGSKS
jgi:hypothetical protein